MELEKHTFQHWEDLIFRTYDWAGYTCLYDGNRPICTTVGTLDGALSATNLHAYKSVKVLVRGVHLWDQDALSPKSLGWETIVSDATTNQDKKSFFVGYDNENLNPVFACRRRKGLKRSRCGEMKFKMESRDTYFANASGISPYITIFHHGLSASRSVSKIQSVLGGMSVEDVYADGDYSRKQLETLISKIYVTLGDGSTPKVLPFVEPCSPTEVPADPDTNIDALPDPSIPEGPGNRPLRSRLPHLQPLIYHGSFQLDGFVFEVPLMTTLSYPDELYDILRLFAWKHQKDKFVGTTMLFAVQLWVDINNDPDRKLESYHRRCNSDTPRVSSIPNVPLAVFIIYFEHWLKVHELLRCTQYAHPFRIINNMYLKDRELDTELFSVRSDAIDETKVLELVRNATSSEDTWPPSTRVPLFPWLAAGTAMAPPVDLGEIGIPNPKLQALIGLPSIRVLGLPSLHRSEEHVRCLAIPGVLSDVTFHGLASDDTSVDARRLSQRKNNNTTSIFDPFKEYGTVWKHELHSKRVVSTSGAPRESSGVAGHPLKDNVGVDVVEAFHKFSSARLDRVRKLKLLTPSTAEDLFVGHDGMLSIDGVGFGRSDALRGPFVDERFNFQDNGLSYYFGINFASKFIQYADVRLDWIRKINRFTPDLIQSLRIGEDGLLYLPGMPSEDKEHLLDAYANDK